eukprot:TRINITY_DN9771_c0_g2_i2.p1 TRINITY_DN9771_c0_g2~~TRINITY_DN9771_c0_g2_i2.p1  ORF type:complete len:359 (+),score=43.36 TRINITY_DN9771_c0_g2_i2:98-1078(+)
MATAAEKERAMKQLAEFYDAREDRLIAQHEKELSDLITLRREKQAKAVWDLLQKRQEAETFLRNGWATTPREVVVVSSDGSELLRDSFRGHDRISAIAAKLSGRGTSVHLMTLGAATADYSGNFKNPHEWFSTFYEFLKTADRTALASSSRCWRKHCVLGGRQIAVSSQRARRLRLRLVGAGCRMIPRDLLPKAVLSDSTTLGSLDFFDVNELLAVFENAPECDECGRGAGKPALGLEYKVGCYRYDGRLKRLCVACFGSLQRCDGCGKKYCSCDGCNDMDYPACDSSLCDDCLDEHIMTCKVCLQRSVQEEVLEDARREVMPWRG